MPKRRTSFDDNWLTDCRFKSWIAKCKTSDDEAYCDLCKKLFLVNNGGKLNDCLVKLGGKPLIEIGSCTLHVMHNGFRAGLQSVDQTWGVEDFLSDVFTFFKKYPSRSEDFSVLQQSLDMEKKAFKRFVSNRWLSVGPVCERIIVNWKCLDKYFLKTEHTSSIKDSGMYKRIAARMQEGNIMLARLHFVLSVANLFSPFLTKFQSECTSIHLLFEELAQVLQLLLQRFVKSDELKDKTGAQLLSVQLVSRSVEACEFGTHTKGILNKLKADKNPRLALLHKDMIQFLKRSSTYLQERLPLQNKFLFSVQCLKPSMRSNPDSIQMMNTLAASVPHVACDMNFLDSVSTEWRLYQVDADISPEWAESADGHVASVDEYWSQVAKQKDGLGNPKYINLMLVVKAVLCVSHGQADVERGFSLNKHIVDETRVNLKQHTISALRTVKDVINKYQEVEKIPVTRDLIRRFRGAHAAYTEFLSSQQKEATASEQDKQECLKRAKETESLQQKQADITKKQKDAEKLISEANDRLLKAAANQNTTDLMAAQALLQSGTKMLVEARGEQDGLKEPQQHNKKRKIE